MKTMTAVELIDVLKHYPPDAMITLEGGGFDPRTTILANGVPVVSQDGRDEHGFGLFVRTHSIRYRLALVLEHGQARVMALGPHDEQHHGFIRWIRGEEEYAVAE